MRHPSPSTRCGLALLLVLAVPAAGRGAPPASDAHVARLREKAADRARARDFAGAERLEKAILERSPDDLQALLELAELAGRRGRLEEQKAWAEKALAVDPKSVAALVQHGNALASLGAAEPARADYEQAAALDPASPLPLYGLGVLREQKGEVAAALAFYERAVALDPTFECGLVNQAAMLANLGRFDEAAATLRKVLARNPEAGDAAALLRRVEQARAASGRK